MHHPILRRLLKVSIAVAVLLGLGFGYKAWADAARMAEVTALAEQVEKLPRGQDNGLRDKLRVAMGQLSRDQRRKVFEGGEERRMKSYFQMSKKEQTAYLDQIIRRQMARRTTPRPTTTAATKGATGGNAPNANANGGGQGRQNQSPEQRAEQRRARLDQTTPEQRGMRAEFARAMQDRRAQLGLRR